MDYFVITIIATGGSYLLYHFFLKKEKSFKFNRAYLLGSLTLCLLAPVMEMDFLDSNPSGAPSLPKMEFETTATEFFTQKKVQNIQTVKTLERGHNWFLQSLFFGYCIITGLFLFRFFHNLFRILKRIKSNELIEIDGLRAIPIEEKNNPYSFFNYLFINDEDLRNRNYSETVICHEKAHSREFHSVDLLYMELLTCFFWLNPFLWLYKKAVVENHEFLADAEVAKAGTDLNKYSHQLIQAGNKHKIPLLISGFNFSLTKNRICMLHKKRSSKIVLALKTGIALALFSIVFALVACSSNYDSNSEPFVVVVDPGHGGEDPGFANEKEINLQVAKKLEAMEEAGDIEIILTRDGDEFVSLMDRVKFTKKQNADLFLSLHCNAANDKSKRGVEAFYTQNGEFKKQSHKYSQILVGNYYLMGVGMDSKIGRIGIAMDEKISSYGFLVLKEQEIPAVMMELGFLSNPQEAKKLKDPERQQAIAENIYKSLLEIKEKR